jgi:hypothetical protein
LDDSGACATEVSDLWVMSPTLYNVGYVLKRLTQADTTWQEPGSQFQPKISLFPGQNSLIPVLEFPVNFTGVWAKDCRSLPERRDLPGQLRSDSGAN